jgi:ribokinase
MKKPKILVVGSFVMDTITSTEVFPQAGQTVLGYKYATAPGGKGANQAFEAALLGADVTMVGKVGQDAFGDRLIASLKDAGANVCEVMRARDGVSSGIGNITIHTKNGVALNNRIIVIPGANMEITPEDVAYLKEDIAKYDMVILQLEIPMEINQIVAGYAYEKGVPVMLNPAPIAPLPEDLLRHITYLSPNETEAAGLLGVEISRKEDGTLADGVVENVAAAMKAKGLKKLLITLGDQGAMIIEDGNVTRRSAVSGIKAVDPTAAGDSFVGAFCMARAAGLDEGEALEFSNMIGARTVSFMGAQPSLSTLDQAIAFHREAGRDTSILEKVKEILS